MEKKNFESNKKKYVEFINDSMYRDFVDECAFYHYFSQKNEQSRRRRRRVIKRLHSKWVKMKTDTL